VPDFEFTDEQKRIVGAPLGYYRILAVAGSGKTETITNMALKVVDRNVVSPERILMVTFTRLAVREMKERLEDRASAALIGVGAVFVSTLHSLCYKICEDRVHGSPYADRSVSNWADWKTERSFREYLCNVVGMARSDADDFLPELCELYASSKRAPIDGFHNIPPGLDNEVSVVRAFKYVEGAKKQAHGLTFDDMPQYALHCLDTIPAMVGFWSNRFDLIVIDEFQDTDFVQYRVVRHLTSRGAKLVVVGDDDQCLYKWRGARPHLMVTQLLQDYERIEDLPLTTNFRSGRSILAAANACIAYNRMRIQKRLVPRPGAPDGAVIWSMDESSRFQDVVPQLVEAGCPLHQIAFIDRFNAGAAEAEAFCLIHNYKYVIHGNQSFHQTREVGLLMAYLRLITGVGSQVELDEALDTAAVFPLRGYKRTDVRSLHPKAPGEPTIDYLLRPEMHGKADIGKRGSKRFNRFIEQIGKLRRVHEMAPYNLGQLVAAVRTDFELDKAFMDQNREGGEDEAVGAPALDAFQEVCAQYDRMEDLDALIGKMRVLKGDGDATDKRGRIQILTGHKAKGLEFDVVFVHGVQGKFPHNQQSEEEGAVERMEDERRIFYVMLTRARHIAFLHGDSQFFEEACTGLPPQVLPDLPSIWEGLPPEAYEPPPVKLVLPDHMQDLPEGYTTERSKKPISQAAHDTRAAAEDDLAGLFG